MMISDNTMISIAALVGFVTLFGMIYWAHYTLDKMGDDNEGDIVRKVVSLAFGTCYYPIFAIFITVLICNIINGIVS